MDEVFDFLNFMWKCWLKVSLYSFLAKIPWYIPFNFFAKFLTEFFQISFLGKILWKSIFEILKLFYGVRKIILKNNILNLCITMSFFFSEILIIYSYILYRFSNFEGHVTWKCCKPVSFYWKNNFCLFFIYVTWM